MPVVLNRLQGFLDWVRLRLSRSKVVTVEVLDAETNHKICIHSSSVCIELCREEVGELTFQNICDVLCRHTSSGTVIKLRITGHCHLNNIPICIRRFVALTTLDLSYNYLSDLPWSIMYLSSLRVLNLSDNCFQVLPPILGYLTCLERLLVRNNKLESLPTCLLRLDRLVQVDVEGNKDSLKSPLHEVCLQGLEAVLDHLRRRCGRINLWKNSTFYISETESSHGLGGTKVKSLLEICVVTVLKFKINFATQNNLAPPLKRHLHENSVAKQAKFQVCKCSRCMKYFSTQAFFDSHECN